MFHKGSDLGALAHAAREGIARQTVADPPPRALLYVDQGEELYACAPAREAKIFSRLLADAVRRPELAIITSIRSDYYGRLQEDEALFGASERIDVSPLTLEQIKRVIREPAARLGARFEDSDDVRHIADATVHEPGSLPLLSYLMSDTWEAMRRDDSANGTLRFATQIMDIGRPLVERAEQFLNSHQDDKETLRRLFTLKLAHVPREGEPLRRRALRSQCTEEEWTLAEALAGERWRLLSTSEEGREPTVEISHEVLLREWRQLRNWLEKERDLLIWKGEIDTHRREWEDAPAKRKNDALLTGLALDKALNWLSAHREDIDSDDQRFIHQSVERRRNRQRRIRQLSASVVVILAVLSSLFAWQWYRAEETLHSAQLNQARFLAFQSRIRAAIGDFPAAIVLAVAGMPQAHPEGWPEWRAIPEVPRALVTALYERQFISVFHGHDD